MLYICILSQKQVDKGTACANLGCRGFVQQSKQVFPGLKITPVSTVGGQQSYLHLKVFKVIIIINTMKKNSLYYISSNFL